MLHFITEPLVYFLFEHYNQHPDQIHFYLCCCFFMISLLSTCSFCYILYIPFISVLFKSFCIQCADWCYFESTIRQDNALRPKWETPIPSWRSILSFHSAAFSYFIFFFCLVLIYGLPCPGFQAVWTGLCAQKWTRKPLTITGEIFQALCSLISLFCLFTALFFTFWLFSFRE